MYWSDGNTIPVITFAVSQTDTLTELALGVSGTTQTLQFVFKIVPSETTTTFVSSPISGINGGDFGMIWMSALQPVYAQEVAKMGTAGVALPRITGFDFLFDQAKITIEDGFVAVLTDVKHVSDTGLLYLLSKPQMAIDLGIAPPASESAIRNPDAGKSPHQ